MKQVVLLCVFISLALADFLLVCPTPNSGDLVLYTVDTNLNIQATVSWQAQSNQIVGAADPDGNFWNINGLSLYKIDPLDFEAESLCTFNNQFYSPISVFWDTEYLVVVTLGSSSIIIYTMNYTGNSTCEIRQMNSLSLTNPTGAAAGGSVAYNPATKMFFAILPVSVGGQAGISYITMPMQGTARQYTKMLLPNTVGPQMIGSVWDATDMLIISAWLNQNGTFTITSQADLNPRTQPNTLFTIAPSNNYPWEALMVFEPTLERLYITNNVYSNGYYNYISTVKIDGTGRANVVIPGQSNNVQCSQLYYYPTPKQSKPKWVD